MASSSLSPFDRLSDDVKSLIIQHILRPTDLRNVCLVNHQLHEIAVRFLYHDIALDLGSVSDINLLAFLNPRNIGLKHIRMLCLNLAHAKDRADQKQQAQFTARMIVEWLPEDILECFSWSPWKPFSHETLHLLYKRQRKLKSLEAISLDKPLLPLLKSNSALSTTTCANIRGLAIYPDDRSTLELGGFFLEHTADKLEDLIVRCNFRSEDRRSREVAARELNDSANGPGRLCRSIFGHLMRLEDPAAMKLKNLSSLDLEDVNLRYCNQTWCKFVNFHQITSLRLHRCHGAESLLGALCTAGFLPRRLETFEFGHQDHPDDDAMAVVEGLLHLVSGIKFLALDMENVRSMPAVGSILRHAKTLVVLNVHCERELTSARIGAPLEEIVWDVDDFVKICKACRGLEELSCAWPTHSIYHMPKYEWQTFENAALSLRELITLHITTWPTNKIASQPSLLRPIYEVLLRGLAERMFRMCVTPGKPPKHPPRAPPSPNDDDSGSGSGADDDDDDDDDDADDANAGTIEDSEAAGSAAQQSFSTGQNRAKGGKLRLIAFGTSEKIQERQDSENQIIYLRSTCVDGNGHEKPYATWIGWGARQFVEPRSQVLDYVMQHCGRDSRPPFREGRSPWTSETDEYVPGWFG